METERRIPTEEVITNIDKLDSFFTTASDRLSAHIFYVNMLFQYEVGLTDHKPSAEEIINECSLEKAS